jgi:gem associated protein 8
MSINTNFVALCFVGSEDGLPPQKQVGLQRTQAMKLMYGEAAPMILGMETAMQLSFDRNCDLRQPKLWPNIPLKM